MSVVEKEFLMSKDILYFVRSELIKEQTIEVPSSVRVISDNAIRNQLIHKMVVPSSVEYIGFKSVASTSLEQLIFEPNSRLSSIGYGAFADNDLKKVELPSSIVDLGEQCFYGNHDLELHVSNLFTRGLMGCGASIYFKGEKIESLNHLHRLQLEYVKAQLLENFSNMNDIERIVLNSKLAGMYCLEKKSKIYYLKKL